MLAAANADGLFVFNRVMSCVLYDSGSGFAAISRITAVCRDDKSAGVRCPATTCVASVPDVTVRLNVPHGCTLFVLLMNVFKFGVRSFPEAYPDSVYFPRLYSACPVPVPVVSVLVTAFFAVANPAA